MKINENTNQELLKIFIPIGAILIIVFSLFFFNNKTEKQKNFITAIIGINYAIKKSVNLSTNGKIDIRTLPKTIKLDDKEYLLDYKSEFLTIKNFNDEDLCNQEMNIIGMKGVYVTGGIKIIQTKCINNNMIIKLENIHE